MPKQTSGTQISTPFMHSLQEVQKMKAKDRAPICPNFTCTTTMLSEVWYLKVCTKNRQTNLMSVGANQL
jgi:hypothetical protein